VESSAQDVAGFAYLWDGSEPGWVLVHVNADEPEAEPAFIIFNKLSHLGVLICEDDELRAAVIDRIRRQGVEIISSKDLRSGRIAGT
jgi:hypothetical protein